MSKDKKQIPIRTPHEDLAKEAKQWDNGSLDPKDWEDAPEAVPVKPKSTGRPIPTKKN